MKLTIDANPIRYQKLNIFCLLYLCTWALLPAFAYYTSESLFRWLYAGIALIWILTGIVNTQRQYIRHWATMGFFLMLMLIYYLLEYGDLELTRFVEYILLLGFGINSNIYNRLSKITKHKIKNYLLCCILITVATTTAILLTNTNVARLLTSSSTDETTRIALEKENVASFDFIYGLLFLLPSIAFRVKRERVWKRLINFFIMCSILFCIIKANFTTAYILLIAEMFLYILPKRTSAVYNIFTIAIMLGLLAFGPNLVVLCLELLCKSTGSIYSQQKIMKVIAVLQGSTSLHGISVRFSLLLSDIQAFCTNPIFGVGAYYSTSSLNGVGQHSQILDELARYGLLGAVPLFYFLIGSIRRLWRVFHEKGRQNPMFIPTVIFLALSFLNPVFNDGILTFYFIVLPFMISEEKR